MKWIKVTDDMPKEIEDCLIWEENEIAFVERFGTRGRIVRGCWEYGKFWADDEDDTLSMLNITYYCVIEEPL